MIIFIAYAGIFVFCCLLGCLLNSCKNKGIHPRSRASNTYNGRAGGAGGGGGGAVTFVGGTYCGGGGDGGDCGGGDGGGDGGGGC